MFVESRAKPLIALANVIQNHVTPLTILKVIIQTTIHSNVYSKSRLRVTYLPGSYSNPNVAVPHSKSNVIYIFLCCHVSCEFN